MSAPSDRVLILGLDGGTWSVFDPMRRRGVMPNLDALLARSAHGTLRSVVPPVTTAAWTSLLSGCGPIRHGVFDHRYYDAPTRQMKVNHSGRRRVPTMWHALSDAGRSIVSLNVPGTYPPPKVRGVVVSGMDAPHLDAATSGDPAFAARLKAEAPAYTLRYFWKSVPRSLDELRENSRRTAESFAGRADGAFVADRAVSDWSVLMVQFQNLDPFQHRCWRFLNVDGTGVDDPAWNDAAAIVLRGLDDQIGRLCELAERRGAAVLVVSDHGFGPCLGRIAVNRILLDAGLARSLGPIGGARRAMRLGRERLRLHAQKKGDPAARHASFAASVDAQLPLDWRRTRAFAPHQDTAAMVYLNTRVRHPDGPLTTPRQVDEARNEAVIALATARHRETHLPLFPQVINVADEYGLDPAEHGYPDLIALPDEAYWVRTKLAAGDGWVEPDPNLPGTHRMDGVVALCAPGVPPGRTLAAHITDVAPTVLTLCGVPVPAHMEGAPLPALPAGLKRRQDAPSPVLNGPHKASTEAAAFEFSAEDQAILEKRLADLGYLE
jgi:predicted AlkP superfamily phosphohydrolase/phosphomutase